MKYKFLVCQSYLALVRS